MPINPTRLDAKPGCVVRVPKSEVDKREEGWKRERARSKTPPVKVR
jgi:hypothetical protein